MDTFLKTTICLISTILILFSCNNASDSTLCYNYKISDITPQESVVLAGLSARKGLSTGIHNKLYTRSLVISSPKNKICIVSSDLLEMPTSLTDSLRAEISQKSGLPVENIFLHFTHTHSAPATYGWSTKEGKPNCKYATQTRNSIVESAVECILEKGSYKPFTMELGIGKSHINNNRRDTSAGTDRDVYVLRLLDREKNPVVSLINYACHPVTLHSGSKVVSTDFPGFTVGKLEEEWGGSVIYLSGACGNSNPSDSLSRFHKYAQQKGLQLAEDVKDMRFTPIEGSGKLTVYTKEARLPFQTDTITEELLKRHIEEIKLQGASSSTTWNEEVDSWAEVVMEDLKMGRIKSYLPLKISAVNIGGVILLFSQGEPYMEYQSQLREEFPNSPILFIAYTNGQNTYLPSKVAYSSEIYDYDTKLVHVDIGTPYPLSDKMPELYSNALKEITGNALKEVTGNAI